MEKEVIFPADVEAIFGKRPWKSRSEKLEEIAEKRRQAAASAAASDSCAKAESDSAESDSAESDSTDAETPPPFEGDIPKE